MSRDESRRKPVLAVDVDGVISLFGFEGRPEDAPCEFRLIDGMAHCISFSAGERLRRLIPHFDLIWATGWEDRANEYLLQLLDLPPLPVLRFGHSARFGSAHWKLEPISEYAVGRRVAWIDDSLDQSCREWAERRIEPTLLITTRPDVGLEDGHVETLVEWAVSGAQFERDMPDDVMGTPPEMTAPRPAGERGSGERGGASPRTAGAPRESLRERLRRRLD